MNAVQQTTIFTLNSDCGIAIINEREGLILSAGSLNLYVPYF